MKHTGEKPFLCSYEDCDHKCSAKQDLDRHERTHSGQKPFACEWDECEFATAHRSSILIHNRSHTENKPFVCDFEDCTYSSTNCSALNVHIRIHTGERPYSCDFQDCKYTAQSNAHLNTHMYTHTGEKPYECNFGECKYACTTSNGLKSHMYTHTGKKPWKCDFGECTYACTSSNRLKNHRSTHEMPVRKGSSKIACLFLDEVARHVGKSPLTLQHYHYDYINCSISGSEHNVRDTRYHCDGYFDDGQINLTLGAKELSNPSVIEFLGNEWHGYEDESMNTGFNHLGVSYMKLHDSTMERLHAIKMKGYNVFYIWENDFTEWCKHSTGTSILNYIRQL